jgi:hypothetical protein
VRVVGRDEDAAAVARVRARPSTAVPTTGTPSPSATTALCDHDSCREGTTWTAAPEA